MKQALAEPGPGGHAAGQGHARRPAADARRGHPRRAHPAGLRPVHGHSTATCSPTTRRTWKSSSTRWPAGCRRPSGCSTRCPTSSARNSRTSWRRRWRTRAWPPSCRALGDALRARRPELGRPQPRGADVRRRAARPRRRDQRRRRPGRPGRPGVRARPGVRRARTWRTSTRRRSAARSAGRRSTTCRRCAGSSASCSSRAT